MGESWVFRVNEIKRNWLCWIERKLEKIHLVQTSFSSGEGNGNPLQYSCLENPMDGGVWWAAVHGGAKSQTQLSNFTCTFHFHALEKGMATHSIVLAWRIPGTEEPGGLPSMGSQKVGHDWSDLAAAAAVLLDKITRHMMSDFPRGPPPHPHLVHLQEALFI